MSLGRGQSPRLSGNHDVDVAFLQNALEGLMKQKGTRNLYSILEDLFAYGVVYA